MAGQAESWVLPKMDWVFQRCGFQPPIPENLLEQLDLGFAFTAPLNIKVINDNGKAPSSGTGASDCVLGAPAGHAAIEKGCPPGQAVPAAAPAVNPGADAGPAAAPDAALVPPAAAGKGRGRGKAKGRGKGPSPKPAAVKTKAKAKAASDSGSAPASAAKRRRISIPSDADVGCAKCYHNKEVGCTTCRPKAGLVESSEKGKWVWKTDDSA